MHGPVEIRTMRREDVDAAARWTDEAGWTTETREEFELFLERDPAGCLFADASGRPAGVCVATSYGERGFVGELLVDRSFRGGGVGPTLFDLAVARLTGLGCRAVSLDAVARAVPFYESRGFRPVARSLRLLGRVPPRVAGGLRPLAAADLPAVLAVDRRAFGGDRSFFLERRLAMAPELAWVRTSGGRVTGYVFGRRREAFAWAGPLWASPSDADPGPILAAFASGAGDGTDIMAGVLESNKPAVAAFAALGFKPGPRMILRMTLGAGEGPGGDPSLLAIGTAAKG